MKKERLNIIKNLANFGIYIYTLIIIFISLAPIIWVVFSSFKTNREILSGGLGLPETFDFGNYIQALTIAPIINFYGNSILVSVLAMVFNVFFLSMAAYVIARFKWRGKTFFKMLFSVGLLIPGAALLQPLYQVIVASGLYDSLAALIVVYMAFGLATTVFIMNSYFLTIPYEMEESAYIDGASFFKTYFKIILPMARPALATAGILEFLLAWNEFQFALTLTSSNTNRTLPIALYYFKSQFSSDYGAMFAATIMVVLPSIILYILLQKQVISGLSAGAVKG